jgi:type I restriction enzyme S subunit
MSQYKPYPAYKDSGVEWLGKVPVHWALSPIKYLVSSIESGTSVNATDIPAGEGECGVLKTSCVYSGKFDPAENKAIVPEEYGRASCPLMVGSLIVSRMNTPDLVGAAGLVSQAPEGIFLPDRLWQISFAGISATFAYYWSQAALYRAQVKMVCTGTSSSMQNLSQDQFKDFVLGVPSCDEQKAISACLDRETARIDALVEKKTRFIELLREKRQALITHAVTKGLDPKSKMKDSGVEWLREVPEHWEVMTLKYSAESVTSGPRGWSELIDEGGDSVFVQSGDLNDKLGIDLNGASRIAVKESAETARTKLRSGDVVVCITGAKTGRVAIAEKVQKRAYVNQHLCLVRPLGRRLDSRFLALFMAADPGQTQLGLMQYGLKEGLSLEDIRNVLLIIPPLEEQEVVVSSVNARVEQLDRLVTKNERSIDLLKERRAALITAAVTGQIDLRESA